MGKEVKKIEYPYLPEGRSIDYVPEDNVFLLEAKKTCKDMATDWGHPSGAVVVLGGKVIGRGALRSQLSHKKLIKLHLNGWCVRKFLKIKSGQRYWLCPGCAGFEDHSESRAVKDAVKHQGNIKGADMYFWGHWWCCKPCWDKIIKAGINRVFLMEGSEVLFNPKNPKNIIGDIFRI